MVALKDSLVESHLAVPEAVGAVRRSVAEYAQAAGIAEPKLDDVRLAVSEAVGNVVRHAYRAATGQVHVTANVVGDELWVLVADDGAGHNVPAVRPGLGWGLAIMRHSCDEFTLVERATGGTEARMCFLISGGRETVNRADQ